MAEKKAEKESLTMRKQGYVIIGIGLAALVGIFRLAQFSKEETPTAAKLQNPSQETTVDSETEKPIDHFAGMRNQSSSEVEPLSEEDKALLAEIEARDKKREAYQNSPSGNWMERFQDRSPNNWGSNISPEVKAWLLKRDEEEMAKYKANPEFRATANLGDWIFRQKIKRSNEHYDAVIEEVERTGNTNLLLRFLKDKPASFATVAEQKAEDAINQIQTGWETEPEPWQEVAAFLRDRRDFSQTELDQGFPDDPLWHAEHIEWIEQTAQTIGIPLDNPEDQSWIEEKIAAAKEQRYQDLDAPLIEELKKIDEETAAEAEDWARERSGHTTQPSNQTE